MTGGSGVSGGRPGQAPQLSNRPGPAGSCNLLLLLPSPALPASSTRCLPGSGGGLSSGACSER